MRHRIVIVLALIPLSLLALGRARTEPAAAPAPSRGDLAARVEALEKLAPDQAHIMSGVGYHFSNLWFAARAENWSLAEFYLNETKSNLKWAVRAKPRRKDNAGRDVNLGNILEAFENSQLTQLKKSIDGKDRASFERAYKESLSVCYSCHKASEKPYLRLQVPIEPETKMINFDPKAD